MNIPDTVHGVIAARLDRLDSDVKEVLRLASVVGRSFLYRVLAAIDSATPQLDRRLTDLQEFELIHEHGRLPELEYMFSHALTQEATYESILLARRRELHQRVAACIEMLFADRLEEFFALLAYHYARAENWEKAQDYLFKAGDQAGRLAADAEALAHYQQAVDAYERAFGDRWDPLQRAVLERKMGEALFRRGDNDQAKEYLARALARLGFQLPTSRGGIRRAIAGQFLRQLAHRLRGTGSRPTAAQQTAPIDEERWRLYEDLAWIDYFVDREQLLLDVLLGLNTSEAAGAAALIARACAGVGLACDLAHAPRLAAPYHQRALAIADSLDHPPTLGLAHHCRGFHDHFAGRWAAALGHFEQAAAIFWDAGDSRRCGAAAVRAAWLLQFMGRIGESRARGLELVRVGRDGGDHQVWGWGLVMVGSDLRIEGALDDAIVHLQQAAAMLEAVPDYVWVGISRAELGQCYLRQMKIQQAVAVFEECNQFVAEHGVSGFFCGSARNGLAEAYLVAAEQAASSQRTEWLKKAQQACLVAVKEAKSDRESLPAAYRVQGSYEWLMERPKVAVQWWGRSLATAEELGMPYELGLTHLEYGKREADREHLEQAEVLFNEIRVRVGRG